MASDEYIATDDGVHLWAVRGGSGPDLALAHGGPGLWDCLQPLAELLHPHFRVHRWDQRGAGRSDPDGPFTVERFVKDMDQVRQGTGLKRWIAGGHSWGAVLALLYALHHPDHTAGVLYIAGNGIEWPRWRALHKAEIERRLGPDLYRELVNADDPREVNRIQWATDYVSLEAAGPQIDQMLNSGFEVNRECSHQLNAEKTSAARAFSARSRTYRSRS